jgi:hypothetical protein
VSYPAIARQARTEGGEVFFWDESGFLRIPVIVNSQSTRS